MDPYALLKLHNDSLLKIKRQIVEYLHHHPHRCKYLASLCDDIPTDSNISDSLIFIGGDDGQWTDSNHRWDRIYWIKSCDGINGVR